MRKFSDNGWFAVGLLFFALIILKSLIIRFFPSPWVFCDEQSYFGMAQKIFIGNFEGIRNSHAPGYSLIISAVMMLPTVAQAYTITLLVNIVITSGAAFFAYPVFRKIFNIDKAGSLYYTVAVAILPQFILYNFVVMSEALGITLIYAIFVIMLFLSDHRFRHSTWMWLGLGFCIGFAPIVRSQYIVLIVMFVAYCIQKVFRNENRCDRTGLIISFVAAALTYSVFRFILFRSIGSYSALRESYVGALLKAVIDPSALFDLINIFSGELAFCFVATLFLPTFLIVLFTFKKSVWYRFRDFYIFWIVFIISNIVIATVHANAVMHNLGQKTIYARYLDHIIPIIFTMGIIAIHKYKELKVFHDTRKIYLLTIVGFGATSLLFFAKNNIFANTFTIYIYQFFGESLGKAVLFLVVMAFLFALVKSKRRIAVVGIGFCLMASVVPSICMQHRFSINTYKFFSPIGRWFDDNRVHGADIRIDSNVVPFKELKADEQYPNTARFGYVHYYSTLFWANLLANTVGVGDVKAHKNSYLISDRLLPRKILATSEPFNLYDKEVSTSLELDSFLLSRYGSGLRQAEADWVWMDGGGKFLLDFSDSILPNAHRVDVKIQLRGFYPSTLDKKIEVLLNGESLGVKTGRNNIFTFTIKKVKPFVVEKMVINAKTWDPTTNGYALKGEGLGLDFKRVRVDLY